ncbi:MAG: class I tRNA ligase family protein [bacterium]
MAYNNFKVEFVFQEKAVEKKYYKLQKDKLKKRKFIFNSYPLVHKNSIEMNDLRSFVYADAFARYNSYQGNNVLFTVGINNTSKKLYDSVLSNVLSKDDPYTNLKEKSYEDLMAMDIMFDKDRKSESHSKKFIHFMQDAFLKLYKFNHIIKEDEDFYLDFTNIKDIVISELSNNGILESVKENLEYKSGIILNLDTTTGVPLEVMLEEPEYLAGISFIAIKPSNEVKHLYLDSEIDYINKAVKNKKNIGVFSGNFAINPITNDYIPIVITHHYKKAMHIGIPDIYDNDIIFSSIFGFEYNKIIENDVLVNSSILTNMTIKEAHDKIVDHLATFNNARPFESFNNTKLLISTDFADGISIPFFEDEVLTVEDLPVLIDHKNNVRTTNGKLPKRKITKKVFTTNITQAFLSVVSRLKSEIGITNYSSVDFMVDIKEFPKFDYAIFHSKAEYIFTLVLNIILLKSVNMDCSNIFSNFHILEETPDTKNMVELNSIVNRYGACSLRMDMLSKNLNETYFYNVDSVINCSRLIDKFVGIYDFDFVPEFKELNKSYENLVNNATNLIELNDFPVFVDLLNSFIDKVYEYKKITSRQAKGLLLLFSLIAPSICEQIFSDKFKINYPLLFDSWPA